LAYYEKRNIIQGMILSFKCKDTLAMYQGQCPPRFIALENVAVRKLTQLDVAQTLEFLRSPPGNRLEKLSGDRAGQWSIRVIPFCIKNSNNQASVSRAFSI